MCERNTSNWFVSLIIGAVLAAVFVLLLAFTTIFSVFLIPTLISLALSTSLVILFIIFLLITLTSLSNSTQNKRCICPNITALLVFNIISVLLLLVGSIIIIPATLGTGLLIFIGVTALFFISSLVLLAYILNCIIRNYCPRCCD